MHILVLTKKFPFPLLDGESIAVHHMTKALAAQGHEVTLLSYNTIKHKIDVDHIRKDIPQYKRVVTVDLDNRVKVLGAVKNIFETQSYFTSRFYTDKFEQTLKEIISQEPIDVVLFETIYLAQYIPLIKKVKNIPTIVRAHNVEHEIWERIARHTPNPLKKWYLTIQKERLKLFESDSLHMADGLITLTDRDLNFFKGIRPTIEGVAAAVGIDVSKFEKVTITAKKEVAFIGSLDWMPNIEGVQWFLQYVWPQVIEREPEARCHIAGRNPVASMTNIRQKGVVFHGEVDDARAYVYTYPISIVPLLSGSGMRVKIIEAMACGRAIISTSVGAEGIDTSPMIVSDDASEWVRAILDLFGNSPKMIAMGHHARKVAEDTYDHQVAADTVSSFLKNIVDDHKC